ncbi:MAG: peptidylprolyl isomerase, partial [Isosphaeraceae bacterium]
PPAGDPLLGPNPALMPDLPPLPDSLPAGSKPAAARSAASAKAPAASKTAAPTAAPSGSSPPALDAPPLTPSTDPAGAPPALDPPAANPAAGAATPPSDSPPALTPVGEPPSLGPPSASNTPAPADPTAGGGLASLPPLERMPDPAESGPTRSAAVQRAVASNSSGIPVRRAAARRDVQILRTSAAAPGESTESASASRSRQDASLSLRSPVSRSKQDAGFPAARVGDEVITWNDLQSYVQDFLASHHYTINSIPPEQRVPFYRVRLEEMIDQTLLIQEAKHILKDPKHFDQFTREVDRIWKDHELQQLQNQYHVNNEQKLREKLKEHGQSLDVHYKAFRRAAMAENFLYAKLKNKVKVDLPEVRKYYMEHLRDPKFSRPPTIAWHEIVIETAKCPNRNDARRKIEAIRAELGRGVNFEQLARTQSDGPSSSREQGGLMETSPGSYGVQAVNAALGTLPIGQVSGVLEGPDSFHIVRVDGRRPAGPAPFEEVYDEIRTKLLNKKGESERAAFMAKIRRENPAEIFLK